MFAQVHWPVNVLGGYELVLRDSSLEGFGDIIVLELCCWTFRNCCNDQSVALTITVNHIMDFILSDSVLYRTRRYKMETTIFILLNC